MNNGNTNGNTNNTNAPGTRQEPSLQQRATPPSAGGLSPEVATANAAYRARVVLYMPKGRYRTVDEAEQLFLAVREDRVGTSDFMSLVCASKGAYRGLAPILAEGDVPLRHDPVRARALLGPIAVAAEKAFSATLEAGGTPVEAFRARRDAIPAPGEIRGWIPRAGSIGTAWVVVRALATWRQRAWGGLRGAIQVEEGQHAEAERLASARWLAAAAATFRGRRLVEVAVQNVANDRYRAALTRALRGESGPPGRGREAHLEAQHRTRGRQACLTALAKQAREGAGPLAILAGLGMADAEARRGRAAEALLVVRVALAERAKRPEGIAHAREAVEAILERVWPRG